MHPLFFVTFTYKEPTMNYIYFFIYVLTGISFFPEEQVEEEEEKPEDVQREIELFLLEFPEEERSTIRKLCLS